jgi:subtilisin family serine protease
VAYFSNAFPEISAPGVAILSAKVGGGLTTMSGTSMAAPHVAGVALSVVGRGAKIKGVPAAGKPGPGEVAGGSPHERLLVWG